MPKTPEAKVKDKIKKLVKKYGGYYAMPVMHGMAANGTPDFLCCINGWFLAIEAKAGKNKATDLQKIRLEEIRAAGGISIVVNENDLPRLDLLLAKLHSIPRRDIDG